MRRRILAPLFAAMLLAAPLMAHMKLEKSDPAANGTAKTTLRQVQIWFSEAPDPKLSKLELSGPSGPIKLVGLHVIAGKALTASIQGQLAEGKYTLHWQSAGDDGHVQKGDVAFTVSASAK